MKLPEEVRAATGAKGIEGVMEAIVRDCAKECVLAAEDLTGNQQIRNAAFKIGDAILARYGLEPK